jgi:hypothetical protein
MWSEILNIWIQLKIQEFRYIDTTNVEPEIYDYAGYN